MNREKEQAEQKLCRRYCRELRRALVCVPELRERTLAQITESWTSIPQRIIRSLCGCLAHLRRLPKMC